MKRTTLVIMAAGIGSRFGGGIKQLTQVGPNGETIMDYSIHDALEAGFNKVVFIIRKSIEAKFREIIGNRVEQLCEVEYAFQELDDLPEGFSAPAGRTKPWGTGQAVLACKDILKEPFAVINADDYYGKQAFQVVHDFLAEHANSRYEYCMAGFILKNTLSDNGGVTRGICEVDENCSLINIVETHDIVKRDDGVWSKDIKLDLESFVSMNMWGMTPEFMDILEHGFKEFLNGLSPDDIKSEYLLPTIIGKLLESQKVSVSVLETADKWFGVTYAEDKQSVIDAFRQLVEDGVYSSPLK